ncbi:MAG: FG-GAP repeat domain-containing protein [Planctomycetota bacterium]
MVPALRTDILSGIKTAALREVTITYTIFAAGDKGLWEGSPAFRESTSLSVKKIEQGAAVPGAAFAGDFDGDGRLDRLGFEDDEVRIHTGIPGTRFSFSDEPRWSLEAEFSNDFRVEEVNGDGASDILFFHHDKVLLILSKR